MPDTIVKDPVRESARFVAKIFEHAMVAGMIYLGDRLGLYAALQGAGPLTSEQLAERTGLHERWIREWLAGQAAAGLIAYRGEGRFELTPEMATVLAEEDNVLSMVGSFAYFPEKMAGLAGLPEAFRTGIGANFDARGAEGAAAVERTLRVAHRRLLVPRILPAMDGVLERLQAGGAIADVGCGAGIAAITLGAAFPSSLVDGYDISLHALDRAVANASTEGVTNVEFHNAEAHPLPGAPRYDLICTFDCLHDMTHPEIVAAAIRKAIRDDGFWLIADINGGATLDENLVKAGAAGMYAASVMNCLSSSMSEPGGAGLGTLGLPEPRMRELVEAAGSTRFRRLPVKHPINAYYEVRP